MTISRRELAAQRRRLRRRRTAHVAVVLVIAVSAALLIPRVVDGAVAAQQMQAAPDRAARTPSSPASPAESDARFEEELRALVVKVDAAVVVANGAVPAEASAALAQSRDAADAVLTNASTIPAAQTDAATALENAVTAFQTAVADDALRVLGEFSDAEKATEDALFAQITALRTVDADGLADAVAAVSASEDAVRASAQAYRDGIVAAAQGVSSQPTGGDVAAQSAYLQTYALAYNTAEWGDYNPSGGDCVNFTSQGLLARGWTMDDAWWSEGASSASKPWISTTAIVGYLEDQGFAVSTIDDLDRVRVGDVGVFDWGETGAGWDHTMTVSKVDYSADGPVVYFVSHNEDGQYRELRTTMFTQHSDSSARIYSIP